MRSSAKWLVDFSEPFRYIPRALSDKQDNSGESKQFAMNSALYREFLAEREEILKHKWIESEKAGHDIGFERALLDWIVKYRANWRKARRAAQPVKSK